MFRLTFDREASGWPLSAAGKALTPAESEVAIEILKGKTNPDIARLRGTTVNTVTAQLKHIFKETGLGGRRALAAEITRLHPEAIVLEGRRRIGEAHFSYARAVPPLENDTAWILAFYRRFIAGELTPSEIEVLDLLREGKTVKEISLSRHVSEHTTRHQQNRLVAKFTLSSHHPTPLVVLANLLHLIPEHENQFAGSTERIANVPIAASEV